MKTLSQVVLFAALVVAPSVAMADDPVPTPTGNDGSSPSPTDGTPGKVAAPTPTKALPEPQSDNDVQPQVASPGMPTHRRQFHGRPFGCFDARTVVPIHHDECPVGIKHGHHRCVNERRSV